MRIAVVAVFLFGLILIVGCNNDNNTVNPLPKIEKSYPVFYFKIDNGYKKYGVDSVMMNVSPSVGWPSPAMSDQQGFIGSLDHGTYITDIDSSVIPFDTSYNTVWFTPGQAYQFSLSRDNDFEWLDSTRALDTLGVDSAWTVLSADTVRVTRGFDSLATVIDSVYFNGSDFDTLYRDDSIFFPPDSLVWCNVDSLKLNIEVVNDANGNPLYSVIDTLYYFSGCNDTLDLIQRRIYQNKGWSNPIYDIDTTFTTQNKVLVFTDPGFSYKMVSGTDTTTITGTVFNITLPNDLEFPEYKLLFDR
jgi:hypothetical protein